VDLLERKILWQYGDDIGGAPFFSSAAIGTDRVVIGSQDGRLHCVDKKTGKKIWAFSTGGQVDSSPVIIGDKIIFGSADGFLYMLRLTDGKEIWSFEIGESIISSPAVADGIVVIGADDGRIYAFGK
jgi:outer membrane protein assembly factor BamB